LKLLLFLLFIKKFHRVQEKLQHESTGNICQPQFVFLLKTFFAQEFFLAPSMPYFLQWVHRDETKELSKKKRQNPTQTQIKSAFKCLWIDLRFAAWSITEKIVKCNSMRRFIVSAAKKEE
jgi:hypothetical protein